MTHIEKKLAFALAGLHDLFSEIVEDGRLTWKDKAERRKAIGAFSKSMVALREVKWPGSE